MMRQLLVFIAMAFICLRVAAQTTPFAPEPVRGEFEAYRASLSRLQAGDSSQTIAGLYAQALALGEKWDDAIAGALKRKQTAGEQERALKPFIDFDWRKYGLLSHVVEMQYVLPDPVFFLSLAKKHGTKADVAFFKAKLALGANLESYKTLVTDYSACDNYGSGEMARQYRIWQKFKRTYPQQYDAFEGYGKTNNVSQILKEIEDTVANGTCACGSKSSVIKEMRQFLTQFPDSPATPQIKVRLIKKDLGLDSMGMAFRFNCRPG